MTSQEFSFDVNVTPQDVVTALERWGIAYFPSYLSAHDAASLVKEYSALFECGEAWVKRLTYQPGWGSKAVAVERSGIDSQRFPLTASIFGADFMHAICDSYLGKPNQFNNALYLTHDLPNEKAVTVLHFDRIFALKFYLYLLDTSCENGAFEISPGSHHQGRATRCRYLEARYKVEDIPITEIPEDIPQPVPIESPAGTLIIFDTDIIHRGGVVSPGTERLIMRGHSHSIPRDYCP